MEIFSSPGRRDMVPADGRRSVPDVSAVLLLLDYWP